MFPIVGESSIHCLTLKGSVFCCGSTDPGMETITSNNKSSNAVRMLVSCRQINLANSLGVSSKVVLISAPQMTSTVAATKSLAQPIVH